MVLGTLTITPKPVSSQLTNGALLNQHPRKGEGWTCILHLASVGSQRRSSYQPPVRAVAGGLGPPDRGSDWGTGVS